VARYLSVSNNRVLGEIHSLKVVFCLQIFGPTLASKSSKVLVDILVKFLKLSLSFTASFSKTKLDNPRPKYRLSSHLRLQNLLVLLFF
jgi:hypothetical protein